MTYVLYFVLGLSSGTSGKRYLRFLLESEPKPQFLRFLVADIPRCTKTNVVPNPRRGSKVCKSLNVLPNTPN